VSALKAFKTFAQKHCKACGSAFAPEVQKIANHCSADCLYEVTGKLTIECKICGDDFDPEFTKTFNNCGCKL
jgi:transcription elongation factor Elf1